MIIVPAIYPIVTLLNFGTVLCTATNYVTVVHDTCSPDDKIAWDDLVCIRSHFKNHNLVSGWGLRPQYLESTYLQWKSLSKIPRSATDMVMSIIIIIKRKWA